MVDSKGLSLCINDVHKLPMKYGYAQVSTDGQSLDAQVKQLRVAGAEKVFKETASGARGDRAQLRRVIEQLDKGDVLTVTRLDRLARSTRDLLNTLAAITGIQRKVTNGYRAMWAAEYETAVRSAVDTARLAGGSFQTILQRARGCHQRCAGSEGNRRRRSHRRRDYLLAGAFLH
jgi:hypothetical protein